MHTDYETTTVAPLTTPYDKIFGVVKYRYQLKTVCESLSAIGVREVEILDGSQGLQKLRAWHQRFSKFLLGERETKLLSRYLDALESDLIVFTAVVDSAGAGIAAETAIARGASRVSHFGNSVVTSY